MSLMKRSAEFLDKLRGIRPVLKDKTCLYRVGTKRAVIMPTYIRATSFLDARQQVEQLEGVLEVLSVERDD